MRVDLKILRGGLFFAFIAIGVLAFARWTGVGNMAVPAPVVLPQGLDMAVTAAALTLEVKGCDIDKLGDEFFLHQYPTDASNAGAEGFINQQFNLKALKPVEIKTQEGLVSCQYRVEFSPVAISRVALGQFRMPEGRCCDILWNKEVNLDE
ncbi:hypothetical protein [Pseudomonas sp. Irchel 3H7]|uniref:hypothetical protein n=1 Tax=unclassified Pseudomonas TaxID=196821 RepID=UPI00211528B5|nr:hypothetical protein [Pseudomonas sp. Irchel 3H7]